MKTDIKPLIQYTADEYGITYKEVEKIYNTYYPSHLYYEKLEELIKHRSKN